MAYTIVEIRRHLVTRRQRANPRVVKRKMSNFAVKRAAHQHWPQPTRHVIDAVVIVGASKPAPIRPEAKPSSRLTVPTPTTPTT